MCAAQGLGVVVFALAVLSAPCAWSASEEDQVTLLTQAALRAKTPGEALSMLKQAMALAPEQPSVHLNYATLLFKEGQAMLASGKKEDGRAVFREVEKELLSALRLAKNEPDSIRRAQLKSQSSFLLGDVNFFVFSNKEKAKGYYQEALWYDPQHPGALEARTRYGESLERK